MISRLLLVLALAVLAYIVYITMTTDTFANSTTASIFKKFDSSKSKTTVKPHVPMYPPSVKHTNVPLPTPVPRKDHMNNHIDQIILTPQINYEAFANAPGPVELVKHANPAAFKDKVNEDDGLYATVKYSGLVNANPNDSLQIEGTDLLTAPLVDNMLYTNSISNVNRNASNDLRGDISVQFDKNYTPFYTSTIAGVDRLGGSMNIGREVSTSKVAA